MLTQKTYASPNYFDKKTLKFNVILTTNTATKFSNMHICLTLQIKFKTDKSADIADTMFVNNFFAYWLKEIDIRRYRDDIRILPTNRTANIYRYSNSLLKHRPEKVLKTYQNHLFCSKKPVIITNSRDRRLHTDNDINNRSDPN